MRIVHFAPFAPCGCGLYEAARDMVIADRLAGHDANLVDTGPTIKGVHSPGKAGQVDNRGGSEVISADPGVAFRADVLVAHAGYLDQWIVQTQAPVIWILHGRPAACFRPEQFGDGNSYSCLASIAQWPRVRKMVTFWSHHMPFWRPIVPPEKLICLGGPPVDGRRFSPDGPRHDFGELGSTWNVAIAESWREDVDTYEVTHGALEAAREIKGVRFHFYGMETPLPQCWEYLLADFRRLGALGEVWARRPNIEEIYRAADIVLSPQRIATRIVAEALSCGTPVIAANGCECATATVAPDEPEQVAAEIRRLIFELDSDAARVQANVRSSAQGFSLSRYSRAMNELYERVT